MKETPILLAAILGAGLMFIRPAEALAQIVDTESSGVGQNVSADQVRDLPLNSRNFETLINLTPGVLTDQLPVQPSGQASMGSSQWMIDGVVITDPLPPGSDPTRVNLDAIEEIKVQTGGFEAEYGRATGGVINVVTKTGSNEFRAGTGEPFDFVLNEGTGGTCLSEIQGLPGGGTVRGSIQFQTPIVIPNNFFSGQPLGPGGSIQIPPCSGTEGPMVFFRGSFPLPGTPTHFMLTPQGTYRVDLNPAFQMGLPIERNLLEKNFVVGSGTDWGMDWSKNFKLNLSTGTQLDYRWDSRQWYDAWQKTDLGGPTGRLRISENESARPLDRIFINYNYYNNSPSACPTVPGKTFGFERTFLDGGLGSGKILPLQPAVVDPATCDEIGRSISSLGTSGQEDNRYVATLGGPIIRDRLWFFIGGRGEEKEPQDDQQPINLTYRLISDVLENVPSVSSEGALPGVQNGGIEIQFTTSTGGVELRPAPGGGERGAHDPEPMIYIEALGGATGEVYQATIVGPEPLDFNGYAAIEPVAVSSSERNKIVEQIREAPGIHRTLKANGYCLDFLMSAPPVGAVFRLAGAAAQEQFRPLARVLDAARQLHGGGLLHVDPNPESYFHSIRQWAIWTVTEEFDQTEFIEAFSQQVRENLESGGQAWTEPVAAAVRRHAESRWLDIQQVLELAERRGP